MDTFQCIRTRRTTRTFLPTEVPPETIRHILEAGRLTPSARNMQPWHFVAIQDRSMLRQLAPLCTSGRFIEQASCAVAVVTDPTNNWHEIDGRGRCRVWNWRAGMKGWAPVGSAV
jgi:nitroreductase